MLPGLVVASSSGLLPRRFLGHLVKEFSQSLYGGRVMYHAFLKPLTRNALSLMAEVDRRAPCSHTLPCSLPLLCPVLLCAL